jgi:uncharacterized protein (UPF0548 family)
MESLIRLRRPSRAEIEAVLASPSLSFSYPEVGATAKLDLPAARYDVDHHEFVLGKGRELFERAKSALANWRHFEIPWLELHGANPVASGQVVATLARVAGLWFLNPCRVVYADLGPDRDSVAYAYGTLHGHVECGEERFRLSFDAASHEVRYEILAFSRPAIFLSQVGYPLARRIQRRFAESSARALARAIRSEPLDKVRGPNG